MKLQDSTINYNKHGSNAPSNITPPCLKPKPINERLPYISKKKKKQTTRTLKSIDK